MAVKTIKTEKFTWLYLNDFEDTELNFLKTNFKFHPLDLKDCAGEIQRTKIDVYKNYIFLVFQLPQLNNGRVTINQVYFFVGKNFLITIAKDKVKPLNNFFYKLVNNPKVKDEAFSQDPGYLFYKILDSLLRSTWNIHTKIDNSIQEIETNIYEGQGKKSVIALAESRRIILQLKAVIDPQRIVTNSLSRINVPFLNKDIIIYFDDLDDYIEKNWFRIEGHKDRLITLQEINESLVSFRTNQAMKVLTGFSVALLPLTLLSGIYGMNIDLPFSHNPKIVALAFIIVAFLISIVFFYLNKKDKI